jgi:hypothetical protein
LVSSHESFCAKKLQQEAQHTIQVLRDMEKLMAECGVDLGEPTVYPGYQVY